MAKVAVGVDVGGTNIRFGLVSKKGEIVTRSRVNTGVHEGVGMVTKRIMSGCKAMMGRAKKSGSEVAGVGVGIAGIISADEGVVRVSPNLPGWVDVPLKDMLEKGIGVPAFIENDANAYALGEAWKGAGKGTKDLMAITLGTGVGGGVVLGGRLWRGADGTAGEVGHIAVSPNGPVCGCGSRGCLESFSSATAVVKKTVSELDKGKKSSLSALYKKDPDAITAQAIMDAATAGDRLSIRVYEDAGRYLGIAIAGLINLLNVRRVIIGGGMSGAWELMIGPIRNEVEKRAFKVPAAGCEIVQAMLGDDAGIIGSAGLVFGKGR